MRIAHKQVTQYFHLVKKYIVQRNFGLFEFNPTIFYVLKSVYLRSESEHEFKWFPAKKAGADLSGLPIRGMLFWQETT